MGMASLSVPGSVANRMSTAVAPGTEVRGKTFSFPTGSEIHCVAPAFHWVTWLITWSIVWLKPFSHDP